MLLFPTYCLLILCSTLVALDSVGQPSVLYSPASYRWQLCLFVQPSSQAWCCSSPQHFSSMANSLCHQSLTQAQEFLKSHFCLPWPGIGTWHLYLPTGGRFPEAMGRHSQTNRILGNIITISNTKSFRTFALPCGVLFCPVWQSSLGDLLFSEEETEWEWVWESKGLEGLEGAGGGL